MHNATTSNYLIFEPNGDITNNVEISDSEKISIERYFYSLLVANPAAYVNKPLPGKWNVYACTGSRDFPPLPLPIHSWLQYEGAEPANKGMVITVTNGCPGLGSFGTGLDINLDKNNWIASKYGKFTNVALGGGNNVVIYDFGLPNVGVLFSCSQYTSLAFALNTGQPNFYLTAFGGSHNLGLGSLSNWAVSFDW